MATIENTTISLDNIAIKAKNKEKDPKTIASSFAKCRRVFEIVKIFRCAPRSSDNNIAENANVKAAIIAFRNGKNQMINMRHKVDRTRNLPPTS